MMKYVDGFVLAVPKDKKEEYLRLAERFSYVFKEYGALSTVECWGDDVPEGELTSFPMAVKCKENETVVFSWMTWPSKEKRDEGSQKAMEDPRLSSEEFKNIFDGKRLIYGGFEVILSE